MAYILMGIGILCLIYYLLLLSVSMDFSVIWLLLGGFCCVLAGYLLYRRYCPLGPQIPAMLWKVGRALVFLGILFFLTVEALILGAMTKEPPQNLDCLIVLGAQVKGERPSRALLRRLEAAEKYLEANPRTAAVLSGGQGDGEEITEAECMRRYLTEAGISGERLILEEHSTTTKENLKFSAGLLKEHGRTGKIGVLSNNFHIFRAISLAKNMGYEEVYGVPAKSDWRFQIHYMVREFFALCKEKMVGNI